MRNSIAKLTNVPVLEKIVDNNLFEGDRIIYLPNANLLNSKFSKAEFDNVVLPTMVVEHFIEKANYHWIMDFCICRHGDNCQSFPKDLGCLFLGEAVLKINKEIGHLVSRSEALNHLERCREAGLVHMIGRNKLDSVWLGARPAEQLLTICNCCPCCCLWRMIPYLTPKIAGKVTGIPGVLTYITDECVGCGRCTDDICFVDAIKINDNHAEITNQCRGCGRCVDVCPQGAIEFKDWNNNSLANVIDILTPLVSVE